MLQTTCPPPRGGCVLLSVFHKQTIPFVWVEPLSAKLSLTEDFSLSVKFRYVHGENAANQVGEVKIDLVKSEYGGTVWRVPPSSLWPLRLLLSWRGHRWEGVVSLSLTSHLHSVFFRPNHRGAKVHKPHVLFGLFGLSNQTRTLKWLVCWTDSSNLSSCVVSETAMKTKGELPCL